MSIDLPSVASARADAARDPTIRSRVIALISIVLVPMLGLLTWLAADYASLRRRIIEVQRADVTSNLNHLLDSEIASIKGALTGLASADELKTADFAVFRPHAEAVEKQFGFEAITVYNKAGMAEFSTRPDALALQAADLQGSGIAKVFNGSSHVTDLEPLRASMPGYFSVIVPVSKDSVVVHALSARISAERLGRLFVEAELKPRWVAAIVDRTGKFTARSLHAAKYVGAFARPELVAAAQGDADVGEFENITFEGVLMGNSFRRSRLSDWTSVVAVPKAELTAPFRETMFYVLLGGVLISTLSLTAAYLMAATISEPIRRLKDAATAVVRGQPLPQTPHRIAELNEVRAAFEHAVAKSSHLAAIVASSGDAIVSVDLEGRVQSWNQGAEMLFGYSAQEMIGRSKQQIIPAPFADEAVRYRAAISSGDSVRSESVRRKRDGSLIDVSLDMAPIRNADGRIVAVSSIMHDITNRKRTDKHQRFLMRELTHRSKNLLAIVQSMARQTARTSSSLEDFEKNYMQRLQGLAASHDLLVNQNWSGAPLEELVRRQVDPFVSVNHANLAVSGPHVLVSARAAQSIGLAIHELATNSIKYGSLSLSKGKVSVEWEFLPGADGEQQFQLKWEEHDGPPVSPPTRKGFGHFVIDRMARQSLEANVTIDFRPEGLIWTLVAPQRALETAPDFEGADSVG